MVKSARKISSAAMALLLALAVLASCGDGKTKTGAGGTAGTETVKTAEETVNKNKDDLPEFDFGGHVFRVLSVSNKDSNVTNFVMKFDVSEQTGDIIDDAIYKRNRQIEERFNIVFQTYYSDVYSGPTEELKKIVAAGDDAYELVQLISRDALSCAFQGMIVKVADLPYMDVTKPYYAQSVNDALTIGGVMYFAYNDSCINMLEHTSVVTYNKQLAQSYNTGNLYDTVRGGGWDFDKFFSMCAAATSDLNGDGSMDAQDRYGVVGEDDMFFGTFWLAGGITTIAKDKNDIPYFAANGNEKFYSLITKVSSYFSANKVRYNGSSRDANSLFFKSGGALFDVTILGHLNGFRDMENDFGVVPFPKYDESQDRYYSRVVDGWIHVPPITNTNLEMTSVIIEALGSASADLLIPAYYNQAMFSKVLRDEDSVEMLELIRSSRIIDLGENPWQNTVRNTYINLIKSGGTDVASATEKIASQVQGLIDGVMKTINGGK